MADLNVCEKIKIRFSTEIVSSVFVLNSLLANVKLTSKSLLKEHCLDPTVNPFYRRTLFLCNRNHYSEIGVTVCAFFYSGQPHERNQLLI